MAPMTYDLGMMVRLMTKILLPTHAWVMTDRHCGRSSQFSTPSTKRNTKKRQREKKHVKRQNDPPADATRGKLFDGGSQTLAILSS